MTLKPKKGFILALCLLAISILSITASVLVCQLTTQKQYSSRQILKFQAKKNALAALNIALAKLDILSSNNVSTLNAEFFEGTTKDKSLWAGVWGKKNEKFQFMDWLVSCQKRDFCKIFEEKVKTDQEIAFVSERLIVDKISSLDSASKQYMAYAVEDLGVYPEENGKPDYKPYFVLSSNSGSQLKSDMNWILTDENFSFDQNWTREEINFIRSFQKLIATTDAISPTPFLFQDKTPLVHGLNPTILQSWLEYRFQLQATSEKWLLKPYLRVGITLWNPYGLRLGKHAYLVTLRLTKSGYEESPEIQLTPESIPGNYALMKLGKNGCAFKGILECDFAPGEIKFVTLSSAENSLNLLSCNKLLPANNLNTSLASEVLEISSLSDMGENIVSSENRIQCAFSDTTNFEIRLEDFSSEKLFQSISYTNIFPKNLTITLNTNECVTGFGILQGWNRDIVAPNGFWEHYNPRAINVSGQVQENENLPIFDTPILPWMLTEEIAQITPRVSKQSNAKVPCVLKVLNQSPIVTNSQLSMGDFLKPFLPTPLYTFSPQNPSLKNFMNVAWNIQDYNVPPFVLGEGRFFSEDGLNKSPISPIFHYNSFFWDNYFFSGHDYTFDDFTETKDFIPIEPIKDNNVYSFAKANLQKNGINLHAVSLEAWRKFFKTHTCTLGLNDQDLSVFCKKLLVQLRKKGPFENLWGFVAPQNGTNESEQISCLEQIREDCIESGIPLENISTVDVLAKIGDKLHVRSDTFLIHTYGEVNNETNKSSIRCEAIVQRIPESEKGTQELSKPSKKFRVRSFRWL